MAQPVVRVLVPQDSVVIDRPCIYHGAILIGGASSASTLDLHDGTSTQGERLDRVLVGISDVAFRWMERGIEVSTGIYANVDGNQTAALILYSELTDFDPYSQIGQ